MTKLILHRYPYGISIAIFGVSYTWHTTSLNFPSCWMTSDSYVCNTKKWNGTFTYLFYFWLKTPSVCMGFLSKIKRNILVPKLLGLKDLNFGFASPWLPIPCPLMTHKKKIVLVCEKKNQSMVYIGDSKIPTRGSTIQVGNKALGNSAKPRFPLEWWTLQS